MGLTKNLEGKPFSIYNILRMARPNISYAKYKEPLIIWEIQIEMIWVNVGHSRSVFILQEMK